MTHEKNVNFVTVLEQVPLGLFLPYLEDQDFRALAVCCRVGRAQVKKLEDTLKSHGKAFQNPLPRVLSKLQGGHHDIKLKSLPGSKNAWELRDLALPTNGKWLFVLHSLGKTDKSRKLLGYIDEMKHYCLDIYRQESESPLRYVHVQRRQFDLHFHPTVDKLIRELDNDPHNPGIYIRARDNISTVPGVYGFHLLEARPLLSQRYIGMSEPRWELDCIFSENQKIILSPYGSGLRQYFLTRATRPPYEVLAVYKGGFHNNTPLPHTQSLLGKTSLRFNAPLLMARLVEECKFPFQNQTLFNLLEDANQVLLWQILSLAQDAKAYAKAIQEPHLAGLCALAKSPIGETLLLQGTMVIPQQVAKVNYEVHTPDLGTINTHTFFWKVWRDEANIDPSLDRALLPDLIRILSKRGVTYVFAQQEEEFYHSNPLVFQSTIVKYGVRVIDVCCQSRHETYDKKHKKLIPKSFSNALQKHERLRNYLALDALLKKLIRWLPEQEAKTLESARQRMHDAVAANPSLRFDPVQLLGVRFYRQYNILSAISDPHYRDLLIGHFAPGHDFSLNIDIDEEYSASWRPDRWL